MCGITGEINYQSGVKIETVRRMSEVLAHRGPDDEGIVLFRGENYIKLNSPYLNDSGNSFEVGLGHRRLSIIDLSMDAHQPMANEDRSIWVVFNGEIYNFQEIRNHLEKKGHIFKSRSDTEVIIHSYEEWGVECLEQFRGMFAFGLWDCKHKRLFLARDRLGKKPLVYIHHNGKFAFASEIKALLQLPWVERRVNPRAIHNYLTYQYIPAPESIFEGVKKLPPAHYLLYDSNGTLKIDRYWKLTFNPHEEREKDEETLCEVIRQKLQESVKLRLISDVPVGAFLSGGVDSSIVVGLMAKNGGSPVKTFSIGFEEEEFNELDYARIVSNHFGTDHLEFIVRPDAIEILPKLVWHYNEPFADASAIPTYYVAKMTSDFVKVVLTGDAGDENFAGYPRYRRNQYVLWFTKLPEVVRKDLLGKILRELSHFPWKKKTFNRLADFVEILSSHQGHNYLEQIRIFNEQEKRGIYTEGFFNQVAGDSSEDYLIEKYEEIDSESPLEKLVYLDMMTYLPEDLLVKVDIATMANSLEARVPFLDHWFIEEVARIPFDLKMKGLELKYILKRTFADFLPEPILKRRKMGFGVPLSRWFRNELKDYTYNILLDHQATSREIFKKDGIEKLLHDHLSLRYDNSAKIWALLFLEIWFRTFVDGEGNFPG